MNLTICLGAPTLRTLKPGTPIPWFQTLIEVRMERRNIIQYSLSRRILSASDGPLVDARKGLHWPTFTDRFFLFGKPDQRLGDCITLIAGPVVLRAEVPSPYRSERNIALTTQCDLIGIEQREGVFSFEFLDDGQIHVWQNFPKSNKWRLDNFEPNGHFGEHILVMRRKKNEPSAENFGLVSCGIGRTCGGEHHVYVYDGPSYRSYTLVMGTEELGLRAA